MDQPSHQIRICKHHGETTFGRQSSHGRVTYFCTICQRKRQNKNRVSKKLRAIAIKGGKCELCSYDKCLSALEFHHLDPTTKEDAKDWRCWPWSRIEAELEKCILVCSNCHREIHAPVEMFPSRTIES